VPERLSKESVVMEKEIINRLFSKDELWYNETIHSNLMSKILSVLIDRRAEGLLAEDEYMVQATINNFITGHLRNTPFRTQREWNFIDNSVLCVASEEPMVLYEVKSFIKTHENRIRPKAIFKDILKLAIKKNEYPYIEAYMIIAGKTKVPKDALNKGVLLLPNKFTDLKNRTSLELDISFFAGLKIEKRLLNEAQNLKIKQISISPSRWRNYDGMCAISWRINKI